MSATMERALLVVGSAKPQGTSTSESLARYLLERLSGAGVTTEVLFVSRARAGPSREALLAAVDAADLVILSSPVYVDSLPYLATCLLEDIAAGRRRQPPPKPCRFLALVNCGFPEAEHCRTALDICRVFSRQAGFGWAGGLGLGGGEAIHGRALQDAGGMVRWIRLALDRTAEALLSDSAVPDEAVRMMAGPMVPRRVYTLLGSIRWLRQARENGVVRRLAARPFETGTSIREAASQSEPTARVDR